MSDRDDLAAPARRLPPPGPRLRAIVVVPARDEEQRIERCLERLRAQEGVERDGYEVIVVLDGCTDGTAAAVAGVTTSADGPAVHTIATRGAVGVGRARRIGMDAARDRLRALGRGNGLIATTDADTVVAADWLHRQLVLVGQGARAIGGNIELDPVEAEALAPAARRARSQQALRRLAALRRQGGEAPLEHHHFSGASLGLTVEAYDACGGLPVRAALEDQALADALSDRGIAIHRSAAVRVRTSARTDGRAPRGLARDLGELDWRARRSFRGADYPLERLLAAKRASIALVLPAREVASTIVPIARAAARFAGAGLLDEVLVVDAASADGTAAVAAAEGVEVVQENELLPSLGPVLGKGDAMWRALAAVRSEHVAFVDTDTADFDPAFITGLLGPLVCEPGVRFVKGAFRRPLRLGDRVSAHEGGRVTEILARPLLNLHAPALAVFDQPLAGETAADRALLEALPFAAGYGVEIALLLDAWRHAGLDAMAQVDLGTRQNRHQPLRELSAMAYAVLVAAQARLVDGAPSADDACERMTLPPLEGGGASEARQIAIRERPPLRSTPRSQAEARVTAATPGRIRAGDGVAARPCTADPGRTPSRPRTGRSA